MRNYLFDVRLKNGTHIEDLITAASRVIAIGILEDNYDVACIHLITIL